MSRAPCTFKQTDVVRALAAARKAGVIVQRIEINRDGSIILVTDKSVEAAPVDDLDRELADFEARHAH